MRIIGGIHRSRNILYPVDESKVRPTKDRIREAVFSILQYRIINKDVLDIFAGSGAYGLESMSRGANSATFIDNYDDSIRCINENIKNLKIENSLVINNDFLPALEKLKQKNMTFDVVFIDPPYKLDVYEQIINFMIDNNMTKENVVFVLESDHELSLNKFEQFLLKEYEYGKTYITILSKL